VGNAPTAQRAVVLVGVVVAVGAGVGYVARRVAGPDTVVHEQVNERGNVNEDVDVNERGAGAIPNDLPTPATLPEPPPGFDPKDEPFIQGIHARFNTGDFAGALKLADESSVSDARSAAYHKWLNEQMPALLTSAGWAKLKLGDCDEATQLLRRAEALKKTPETSKGLAVCYYKQKNHLAARDQFAAYLEKDEGDATMQTLYADVLESDGRYDEAVKALERAHEIFSKAQPPAEGELAAVKQRLESMRGRAKESGFQQSETSRNFRLAYRAGDHEDLVAFVLQTLEDALDEYVERYAFKPPVNQIEVSLYPAESFRSVVVGGPEWAEGLFDGRLRIPIRAEVLETRRYDGLRTVLRHELVHALFALMSDSRSIPSWFDEGLAQRLSCDTAGCGAFSFPPKPGAFLPKESFFTPYTSFDAVKAGRAYRQSLYLVQVLERTNADGETALRQLVSGVTITSDLSGDGLLRPLGLTFEGLHKHAASLWDQRQPLANAAR